MAFEAPSFYRTVSDTQVEEEAPSFTAMPSALMGLVTNDVRDSLVESGLSFGKDTILTAKTIVRDQLDAAGLRTERLAVDSEWEGGLVISANIIGSGGKKTIQVPVEVIASQVLMPSVFMSGIVVDSFDAEPLRRFASEQAVGVFNAAFSTKSGWAYKDLYAHVIKNASFGNMIEAEDAMAVIAEEYGPELHRTAFIDLTEALARNSDQSPVDEYENMIAEAVQKAELDHDRIKMSSTLMFMYPKD
jgi:hypothetical protein